MRATSRSRIDMPLTVRMTISPNSSGLRKSVAVVMLNSRIWLSTLPAGTSTLDLRKASSMSWLVSR